MQQEPNAFCALELVVAARATDREGDALGESVLLRRLHWRPANADTGLERAAYSPGDKLRVTYATGHGELASIELGWTKRRRVVEVALARLLFANRPAMSMLVEIGPG